MSSSSEILLSTVFCLLIKPIKTFLSSVTLVWALLLLSDPKFSISLPVLSALACFSVVIIRHHDQKQSWKKNIYLDFRLQSVTDGSWDRIRQEHVGRRDTTYWFAHEARLAPLLCNSSLLS